MAPIVTNESHDVPAPGYHIVAGLFTDDPRWRRTAVVSLLLGAVAGAGAHRAHGSRRVILAVAAVVLLLPDISLAMMIAVALLLKRIDRAAPESASP